MKKVIFNLAISALLGGLLTSCYTQSYTVGQGPKTGIEVKDRSHYLVYGLAPVKTADPVKLAGDAQDYQVTIQHSFVDGLINALTFGIYSPTTTTVVK
ncbi:MAG: Bor family protein [Cyclobacteriaceae bacterium]